MKIEVLYFEGCPNHVPAIEVLRETLNSLGYEEEIHEVEVHTQAEAEAIRFVGSPSISHRWFRCRAVGEFGKCFWTELSDLRRWLTSWRGSIARAHP